MKRFLLCSVGLLISGLAIGLGISQSHAQLPGGSGAPSAVLKQSWETSPAKPPGPAAPMQSPYAQSLFDSPLGATPAAPYPATGLVNPAGEFRPPPFQEKPDPNADIAVSSAQGPWMIFI